MSAPKDSTDLPGRIKELEIIVACLEELLTQYAEDSNGGPDWNTPTWKAYVEKRIREGLGQ